MNFNFNSLSETSFTSESQNYLRPYDIYEVKLTKIEKGTITGKSDGTVYDVLNLEFTGEQGTFSTNLFSPSKESDFERQENPNTHKIQPSSFDRFQFTLMQIAEAINPTGAQKIKDNASKLKTIDNFIDIIIKTVSGKNTKVYLKLVGRSYNGNVYSTLPASCWFDSKENRCKPLNFINSDKSKLNFSAYEIQQSNQYKNATPTNMESVTNSDTDSKEEFDLDDIEV